MNDRIGGILGVVILIQMFFIGIAFGNHCILYNPSTETISVICGSASLSDINEQLVDSSILKQESHGIWILNANLTIANGANLYINSTDASWLKINSTTPNTAHNIDIFGDMTIDSVKVTSWNTTSNNYTTTDGRVPRASMTIPPEATGKTKIRSSEIAYLGYNSSHSEGLAYYGGTGGILENNIIHHLWYGLYLKEGQNVTLTNNHFYANTADGNLHQVPNRPMVTNHSATRDSNPLLAITSPTFNATIPYSRVLVEGTTFDAGFQVQKVEVVVQTYPLDNPTFNYQLANPVAIGNWSQWSIPMNIASVGPHRILAMVTDTTGNQEWAEVTINVPFIVMPIGPLAVEHPKYRIAFVQPSFTEGAYNVGGFYTFYPKYNSTAAHVNVTTDLSNLTAVVPEELADERYIRPLTQQIKRLSPDATVSNIRDEDVHNGYIFAPDGGNAYDVLFLLHDEYATSSSYYNFKRFVNNGGTIVFLDGNVFYAEVSYNKNMHTVTLLKGHDWQFDGKAAVKSVRERYFNENKEWVGSNFLYGDISAPVRFDNNPFNYTHFEENYVNNPNATILLDYGAQIPQHVSSVNELRVSAKIATYELNYGKGKVIVMGLYAQNLVENQAFLQFFDHIVLPRALGQPYRYDAAVGNESVGYWWMNTGKIFKIEVDNQSNAMILTLERTEQIEDNLLITLPRELFTTDNSKTITVNDKEVLYNQTPDDVEIGVEIPLAADATNVQISMTTNNTDLGNKAQAGLSQNRSTVSGSNESVASNNKSSVIANIEIVEGANSATNDEFYKPGIIDVSKGTTIMWTNNDVEVHTVTSGNLDTGARTGTFFDSGYLSTGNTFQHIFNDPRTFDYYCTLHPFMKGKVIVK